MAALNLEPTSLAALAWASSRQAFVDGVGAACLVVRIEGDGGELAKWLRSMEPQAMAGGPPLGPMIAYDTRTGHEVPLRSNRPPGAFTASHLEIHLVRGTHFLVPVRKRPEAGKAFSERVSIGRARNNDIVLRHESVSKFHAWFRNEDGSTMVGDASSRNGTKLNGVVLGAYRPQVIEPGDTLVLGAVEALYAPSTLLWEAIRNVR